MVPPALMLSLALLPVALGFIGFIVAVKITPEQCCLYGFTGQVFCYIIKL